MVIWEVNVFYREFKKVIVFRRFFYKFMIVIKRSVKGVFFIVDDCK